MPKVGDLIRIRKKGAAFDGYEGRVIDVHNGTFTVLVKDFAKDGSAIAPKIAQDHVEAVG